ncbi:MAG TPA: hypothetical protein VM488_10005 [Pseudobacter sp.]|nr:hypothetical protein [Pseudobacter sp.]
MVDKEGSITWKFYAPEPGTYNMDLSYHNAAKNNIGVTITAADQQLQQSLTPTGKVVVEPHGYYTEEFVNTRLGNITFPKAGYYEITFKTNPGTGEKLLFNRLWLNKGNQ